MDATVIIPTYNRKDELLGTLTALARVDYPADRWEAVVVDDGSGDGTEAAVRDWACSTGAPVRFLRQENAGPAAARNRGAAAALGGVLIFIDNDIDVPADFIGEHLGTLAANPSSWVTGRIVHPPGLRGTPFGRYRDAAWESFHRAQPRGRISEVEGMSAANVSIPATDFRRLGGYDDSFTIASSEDRDLAMRAKKAGIHILYHPGIVVVHNDWAVTLERYCERQRLYSLSDILLWNKYGEESPRARLVRDNAPVDWLSDPPRTIARKGLKSLLATAPGRRALHAACRVAEEVIPDSRLTVRAYDTAVAVAIFRGVREGLVRYGVPGPGAGPRAAAAGAGAPRTVGGNGRDYE